MDSAPQTHYQGSKKMPLNAKGKKIMKAMEKQYGKEKAKKVFYSMENSGKLKGVARKKVMG